MVIGLAIVRVLLRRTPQEASVSTFLLFPLLASLGLALRPLVQADWPLWSLLLGPFCAVLYAAFCGRDFSFMGQYLLAIIASSTAIAAIWAVEPTAIRFPISVLAANVLYLTYWVYDLASLLARRRRGEELAAVVDLYRDVLNIFGYVARCIGHWKKHRIWVLPR
jgi:FtsH-binding integral membrane protein